MIKYKFYIVNLICGRMIQCECRRVFHTKTRPSSTAMHIASDTSILYVYMEGSVWPDVVQHDVDRLFWVVRE